MKHLKKFEEHSQITESSGDNPAMALDIKNEYTKLKTGPKGGSIDLGVVGQVADATISNIKKEYRDAIVKVVDDHYILMLK